MNTTSKARQTKEAEATDTRRGGGQRTVTPTRPRVRASRAAPRDARRPTEHDASGPVAAHDGHGEDKPLWEDDRGAMPPEEGS